MRHAENAPDKDRAERAARYAVERGMFACNQFERVLKAGLAEKCETESVGVVVHTNLHGLALWMKEA